MPPSKFAGGKKASTAKKSNANASNKNKATATAKPNQKVPPKQAAPSRGRGAMTRSDSKSSSSFEEDDDDDDEGLGAAQFEAMMAMMMGGMGRGGRGRGRGGLGEMPNPEMMMMQMMMMQMALQGRGPQKASGRDDDDDDDDDDFEDYSDFEDEEEFCPECGEDFEECDCRWYAPGQGPDFDDEEEDYEDYDDDDDDDGDQFGGETRAAPKVSSQVEELDTDDDEVNDESKKIENENTQGKNKEIKNKTKKRHVDPTACASDEEEGDNIKTSGSAPATAEELIAKLGDFNARKAAARAPLRKRAFLKELIDAICDDKLSLVKDLIAKGADVNAKDRDREATPLHYACANDGLEAVAALILAGAKVNAMDGEGISPLSCCAQTGHTEPAKLLLWAGASISFSPSYEFYARDNNHNMVDVGFTALHYAAEAGQAAMCTFLMSRGADVNAKARYDDTPLILAAKSGSIKAVAELLKNPKIDTEIEGGQFDRGTALGKAKARAKKSKKHAEIVEMLLAAGAKSDALKEGYAF